MRRLCLLLLVLFFLGLHLRAGEDFAPIPSAVWAIKDGPKGAVVLEDRLRLGVKTFETIYRVRIFSEDGRRAAELSDLPESVFDLKGRTVYPDGKVVLFNSRKDFAIKTRESGGDSTKTIHMVAPGVTSDCVVEVKWSEASNGRFGGLPRRWYGGLYSKWRLGNDFPTQIAAVEIARPFPLAMTISQSTKGLAQDTVVGGYRVITFRNLPAFEDPIYSLPPSSGFPALEIFYQPDAIVAQARLGNDAYWADAARLVFRPEYEDDLEMGLPFKAFAKELVYRLPEEPNSRAVELLTRLEGRVKNMSQPSYAEKAALPKGFWDDFNAKNLDKAVKTGMSSSDGMWLLYFHLLKAAGLNPKVGLVTNRNLTYFRYSVLNPWQFDGKLLGVETPGKGITWFDPKLRHAAPGVVRPEFQGATLLCLNSNDWKVSQSGLPASPAANNFRGYTYTLALEDELDRISLKAQFKGYPEFLERERYRNLEAAGASKALKERFETAIKNTVVQKAEVMNCQDAKPDVNWEVAATLEREAGRRRVVTPFPGMPMPLWVPDTLESTRTVPIVLPYLMTQQAQCEFVVPAGFRWVPSQEIQVDNTFGRVNWTSSYDPETRKVKVVLLTEVLTLATRADQWATFKDYLGWVKEACQRTILLEKEG